MWGLVFPKGAAAGQATQEKQSTLAGWAMLMLILSPFLTVLMMWIGGVGQWGYTEVWALVNARRRKNPDSHPVVAPVDRHLIGEGLDAIDDAYARAAQKFDRDVYATNQRTTVGEIRTIED